MIYLNGLNGIRAIAAIAVVVSHITLSLEIFGLSPYIIGQLPNGKPMTLDLAGYGVSMFFALSGFLITYLLWAEKDKGSINIRKFYLRRILRIWPLYYSYMLLCLVVYFVFSIEFNYNSLYYYVFYSANLPFVFGGVLPFLTHFWSLGVEEQFYIFWPWINTFKKKNIIYFIYSLIVILLSTKIALHIFVPGTLLESFIHVTRFHCMLFGALAAIYYKNKMPIFITVFTNKYIQLLAWGIMLLISFNQFHFISFLDNEIVSIITVVIIIGQVTKKGLISLENKVFDFLGKISYGIYVVHPLLIFLFSKVLYHITDHSYLNYIIVYVSILFSTIVISYLSFVYLETPFLKLKKEKFTVIKSTSFKSTKF